ncbi:MAG: MoxR family ATPase [Deltaproteobacteria bacterium]|nr:MoxR family ATPase [Deltaproteobacteria bacterium]
MSHLEKFSSIEAILEQLESNRYIADQLLATVIYLSYHMNKPIFLEGEPGVGKTEVAIVLAQIFESRLIRLQCYEGLDANSALYEWNYPKQLLRIKMDEHSDRTPEEIGHVIYSEPYLLKRPLLEAILSSQNDHPVLLIDELDRADEEFEAFLLEILSDFQVSIPEIGTVKATHKPLVVITSNRTRDIHDALKRRCLYHWIDYPDLEKEKQIIRTRIPRIEESLVVQVAGFMQTIRREDLMKKPGISETLDWAEALLKLNQGVLDQQIVEQTLGCILKYREDIQKFRSSIWTDPDKRSQLLAACQITPC